MQHVSGMPSDGLDKVCAALSAQAQRDGRPWDKLIVGTPPLRALNPTHGNAVGASFDGYFEPLVDAVWQRFHPTASGGKLRINTQAAAGVVSGCVDPASGTLVVGGEKFTRPTTADILGCNSGPFTTGPSPLRNAVIPRLAAVFQRTCVLADGVNEHPCDPAGFYKNEPTNHYARIVHEVNLDRKGYAFAYDDVQPDDGADQSGKVNAGDPAVFVVAVGGGNAYVGNQML